MNSGTSYASANSTGVLPTVLIHFIIIQVFRAVQLLFPGDWAKVMQQADFFYFKRLGTDAGVATGYASGVGGIADVAVLLHTGSVQLTVTAFQ
ncbi:MAG: hypothetical protein ACLSA2_01815 [Candidatus Gastranaerophilaceae bacterium]